MLNHAQPNATETTHTILSHENHIIFPKHQVSIVAPVVEESLGLERKQLIEVHF